MRSYLLCDSGQYRGRWRLRKIVFPQAFRGGNRTLEQTQSHKLVMPLNLSVGSVGAVAAFSINAVQLRELKSGVAYPNAGRELKMFVRMDISAEKIGEGPGGVPDSFRSED